MIIWFDHPPPTRLPARPLTRCIPNTNCCTHEAKINTNELMNYTELTVQVCHWTEVISTNQSLSQFPIFSAVDCSCFRSLTQAGAAAAVAEVCHRHWPIRPSCHRCPIADISPATLPRLSRPTVSSIDCCWSRGAAEGRHDDHCSGCEVDSGR